MLARAWPSRSHRTLKFIIPPLIILFGFAAIAELFINVYRHFKFVFSNMRCKIAEHLEVLNDGMHVASRSRLKQGCMLQPRLSFREQELRLEGFGDEADILELPEAQ